jgi:hypothetical protein
MIDAALHKLTADALQARLLGFKCKRMQRAWRNRSPVTQGQWYARACILLNNASASLLDCHQLAAALYVACGELCDAPGQVFEPYYWLPDRWRTLAERLPRYLHDMPERALSRGAYEHNERPRKKPTPEKVCHKLYAALQIWRSGKAGERADIWTITEEAEAAYHAVFSPRT